MIDQAVWEAMLDGSLSGGPYGGSIIANGNYEAEYIGMGDSSHMSMFSHSAASERGILLGYIEDIQNTFNVRVFFFFSSSSSTLPPFCVSSALNETTLTNKHQELIEEEKRKNRDIQERLAEALEREVRAIEMSEDYAKLKVDRITSL